MNGNFRTRAFKFAILAVLAVTAVFTVPGAVSGELMKEKTDTGPKRIALIGASIGNRWDLPRLPERSGVDDYIFETFPVYRYDKTDTLREVLSREEDRPDLMIIKECAVYFPDENVDQKGLVRNWVEMCRGAGVQPMLATTVPVVKSFPLRIFLLSLLRLKLAWPGEKFDAIIEYNDWLREYAAGEGVPVLDLEAALRSGPGDRHLQSRYAKADGLHINEKAYEVLDVFILETLAEMHLGGR